MSQDFAIIEQQFYDFETKGEFEKALKLAEKAYRDFPSKQYQTGYWLAILYSRSGQLEKAVNILKETVESGIWWSPELLLTKRELQALNQFTEFHSILAQCQEAYKKALAQSHPDYFIHVPKQQSNEKMPLILSIHWRKGNANDFSRYWLYSNLIEKFIFAFPQSSQICGTHDYCWDNRELAEKELIELYQKIKQNNSIDEKQVVITGASQGGRLAIDLVLSERIQSKGFIAVIPAIDRAEEYEELIKKASKNHIHMKGVLVTGTKDPFFKQTKKLYELCLSYDFPCAIEIQDGVGHAFPDHFEAILNKAIQFILKTDFEKSI